MKIISLKNSLFLSLAAVAVFSANAEKVQPVREFRGVKPWTVDASKTRNVIGKRNAAVDNPSLSFEALETYDFLEGPDGTTWFYKADYEKDYHQVSEWYTEELIKAYTFTIYDSSFNEVGKIKDKITFAEGETKVAHAVLDPSVSCNFFNSDAKPEVMVYLAMNTSDQLGYQVNYYNKVYTVGGEKDSDGNDVSFLTMPGRCVDTFNAGSAESENFFFTFVDDVYPDPDDYTFDQYLDYINAAKTVVTVYEKAGEDGMPAEAFTKEIYMTRYPGDTVDGIYFISKEVGDTPYFIFSYYEKPYFLDPTGFATDERPTPNNNFIVEVLTYADGQLSPVTTTRIPVEVKEVADGVGYTFYSIGSVAWKDDVDMSVNGTPQAPAFIVAKDNTTAANLDDVESSYELYGNDGKLIRVLAENTESISLLSSAAGDQPHAMMVNVDNEAYTFHFVDLYSGSKVFSLEQANEGDPITAVCERVKGADGKYQYVFELQFDDMDDDGNDIKRLAWFDAEGKFLRIDRINMGPKVMYAAVNMYNDCLSPTLYDDDDQMEYAVLIKREVGNTTRNEFIVADHDGKWYADFTEDDGKGLPFMFSIVPGDGTNHLQMVYNDDYKYNVDIYDLPFLSPAVPSGVNDIVGESGELSATVTFDGQTVAAPGCFIRVFDAKGVMVAEANSSVSLAALPHGFYVAVVKDAAGNSKSLKLTL